MNFNGQFFLDYSPIFTGNVVIGGDLSVSGQIKLADGSDSLPSLTFTNESGLGMERSSAGEISFVSGGSKKLRISGSTLTSTVPLSVPSLSSSGTIGCTSLTASNTIGCLSLLSSATSQVNGLISTNPINAGTHGLTCGAISCAGITASQGIAAGTNTISGGNILSVGSFNNGTEPMTTGAISCGSVTSSGSIGGTSLSSSGTASITSSLTVGGTLASGSITCTGSISCGTNSMTAASVYTTQCYARFKLTAQQTVANTTTTTMRSWSTTPEATIGTTSVTFSTIAGTFFLPVAGVWQVEFHSLLWPSITTGYVSNWIEVNAGTPDSTRYGFFSIDATASTINCITCVATIYIPSSRPLTIRCQQNTGATINCGDTTYSSAVFSLIQPQ